MQVIDDFLAAYRDAWQAKQGSAARIESFWDISRPPLYKAEEIPHIVTGWEELRGYWRHNEGFNEENRLSFSDVTAYPLAEDLLLAGMRMRWDIRFAKDARQIDGRAFAWAGEAMGGDNHVVACLRRIGGAWKLNAWVEAPDAPLLYMADLYKRNAALRAG